MGSSNGSNANRSCMVNCPGPITLHTASRDTQQGASTQQNALQYCRCTSHRLAHTNTHTPVGAHCPAVNDRHISVHLFPDEVSDEVAAVGLTGPHVGEAALQRLCDVAQHATHLRAHLTLPILHYHLHVTVLRRVVADNVMLRHNPAGHGTIAPWPSHAIAASGYLRRDPTCLPEPCAVALELLVRREGGRSSGRVEHIRQRFSDPQLAQLTEICAGLQHLRSTPTALRQ